MNSGSMGRSATAPPPNGSSSFLGMGHSGSHNPSLLSPSLGIGAFGGGPPGAAGPSQMGSDPLSQFAPLNVGSGGAMGFGAGGFGGSTGFPGGMHAPGVQHGCPPCLQYPVVLED